MPILNTTSVDDLYNSLDDIFGVDKNSTQAFLAYNLQKFLYKDYWQIDLDTLYKEFSLSENFLLDQITIHHVTTRLGEVSKNNFAIDNLETLLLSDNALTQFMAGNNIIFKKEHGISIYYNGKLHQFTRYADARLRNRLSNLNDSCVNGFLFSEQMDNSYISLTSMPEIFSDLMDSLDRKDLQYKYYDSIKCYLATIKVSIQDFIFDDFANKKDSIEKTKLILQYVLNYLCFKFIKDKYYCFENPIIRLPDDKSIQSTDIYSIRQIKDYKEIFKY